MPDDNRTASALSAQRVQTAIRFGWTLAETLGQMRKGLSLRMPRQPGADADVPRLSFSDRDLTVGETLWLSAQRLIDLAGALKTDEDDRRDGEDVPELVKSLPDRIRQHTANPKRNPLPDIRDVYEAFEDWSAKWWIRLGVDSELLALAFTFGGGLADTYWHMRPPRHFGQRKSHDSWHELLVEHRMTEMVRRARRLQPYLPSDVELALRHSLREWGIAMDLEQTASGVRIAYPILFRMRMFSWARRWRTWLMRRRWKDKHGAERFATLTAEDEEKLVGNLRRQAKVWADLIHGARLPSDYLLPSDWRMVSSTAFVVVALGTLALIAVGAFALVIVFRLLLALYVALSPQIVVPTDFRDQLTLVSTLAAAGLFLVTQAARAARGSVAWYDRVRRWLVKRKVEQRTWVAWDGRPKGLLWIGLEAWVYSWRQG